MSRYVACLTLLLCVLYSLPASGGVPLPGVLLHGTVHINGEQIIATDPHDTDPADGIFEEDVIVIARVDVGGTEREVGRYRFGDQQSDPHRYALRVRLEWIAAGIERSSDAATIGDTLLVYLLDERDPGNHTETLVASFPESGGISAPGIVAELNLPEPSALQPPGIPSAPHDASKNRYITIDASVNSPETAAYEVSLTSMRRCTGDSRRACIVDGDCPSVCSNNNNLQCVSDTICEGGTCLPTVPCIDHGDVGSVAKYVGAPVQNSCIPLDDCTDQWFAGLVDDAVFRVWNESALHISACEIVPVAVYAVRATQDGVSFTEPLTIATIPKPQVHYGDVVGPVDSGVFTAPDSFVNVVDVQAFLAAQTGADNAPHTTWVDLQSGTIPVVPQQILNVGDLQWIKAGFIGKTYVETPGHEDPGDCP